MDQEGPGGVKKLFTVFLFILNFIVMTPLIIIWAVAGFIAQTVWALLEVLDHEPW